MAAIPAIKSLIDKSLFHKTISMVALTVPLKQTAVYMKLLQSHIVKIKHFKAIQRASDTHRIVYLDPNVVPDIDSLQKISDELSKQIKADDAKPVLKDVELDYDTFTLDDCLLKVLPMGVSDVPSSFEIIGHVAHLNLKPTFTPFKHIIGQLIIDKTPGIRTVVNKLDIIQNEFRVFPLEVVAGEDNLNVEVSQSGCKFKFNFSEVYWNSRLQTEHERIIELILNRRRPVICDMFAGVGPFSIPLAKANHIVYANDLNPQSYKYLVANVKLNKIKSGKHMAYNLDGRAFIRLVIGDQKIRPTDVIMNLPATALEFLDVFKGLYPSSETKLPTIHCYSFSEYQADETDIIKKIEDIIGVKLKSPTVHTVRNVAPRKWMLCTSFDLPQDILRAESNAMEISSDSSAANVASETENIVDEMGKPKKMPKLAESN